MATSNLTIQDESPQRNRFFNLKTLQLILILMGTIVSAYLVYIKVTNGAVACVAGDVFNCDKVQTSAFSSIFNIPVVYPGLAMYLLLTALLLLENRLPFLRENGQMIVVGISVFGWLFSMYLVYIQFFVLQSLCPWCLLHEVIFTLFFAVSIARYLRSNRVEEED